MITSVRIQVITKSIAACERKIAKIDAILYATPLLDIVEGRKKFARILKIHKGDHEAISKQLEPLAKAEKEAFALAKKQIGGKLVSDKVALQMELRDLISELSVC